MKIEFGTSFSQNGDTLVRRAGYGRIYDRRQDQYSYVRRMGNAHFPRFHLYINSEEPLVLNIHLDQKAASYEGSHMHAGDYDSDVVAAEAARIRSLIAGGGPSSPLDEESDDDRSEPHPEPPPSDDDFPGLAGMRF